MSIYDDNLPPGVQSVDIPGNRFDDITPADYYHDPILAKQYVRDYMNGNTDQTFREWLRNYNKK